jgi:replicative DNA helicase
LVELSNKVASAANLEYHARILAEKHIQRELIRISTKVIKDAYEDTTDVFNLLDDAEKGLFAITQNNLSRSYQSMGSLSAQVLKQLEELSKKEGGLTGVPTGFTDLDRLTSGWQPSDLIIIAARPGMGKTSLLLAMALNAAKDFGKGVAMFSLEMASTQLVQRLVSMESEIEGSKMRNGKLADYEWQQLQTTVERLGNVPIFIDDTPGINIFELRAKCRRLKQQYDIQMVIIDYLQLMSGSTDNKGGNREQEIAGISRALKSMAKELSVPVIALSQLSRAVEVRGGSKRPQLSDLRESGCLAGDTLLVDASTGRRITIKELAERSSQNTFSTLGMDDRLKVRSQFLTKAFYAGRKQVFEIKTHTGRTIKASSNHPFYKLEGWVALENLREGDRIATVNILPSDEIEKHTQSDIYWDIIKSITPLEVEDVYDATILEVHNFVANDFIVHNSIEQDADIVGFIYRPEYYQILEDENGQSLKGIAEIIIAKHRHGALETVRVKFMDKFAKFGNLDDPNFGPSDNTLSGPFMPSGITLKSKMDEDVPF